MERTIKFRGICKRTNKFVYGFLVDKDAIKTEVGLRKVNPETVGQLTGLKDKHGVDIYEGDQVVSYSEYGIVEYIDSSFVLCRHEKDKKILFKLVPCWSSEEPVQVIGNIHEQ